MLHEGQKEIARRDSNWRYKYDERYRYREYLSREGFKPDNDPGPGLVARVASWSDQKRTGDVPLDAAASAQRRQVVQPGQARRPDAAQLLLPGGRVESRRLRVWRLQDLLRGPAHARGVPEVGAPLLRAEDYKAGKLKARGLGRLRRVAVRASVEGAPMPKKPKITVQTVVGAQEGDIVAYYAKGRFSPGEFITAVEQFSGKKIEGRSRPGVLAQRAGRGRRPRHDVPEVQRLRQGSVRRHRRGPGALGSVAVDPGRVRGVHAAPAVQAGAALVQGPPVLLARVHRLRADSRAQRVHGLGSREGLYGGRAP
jgi:hypothetical protein